MTLLVAFGAPASHVPLQGSTSKQQGKKRKADDRGDESDEEQLVFWQVKPAPKVSAGDGAMGAEGEDSQEAEAEVEVEHAMEAEALGDGLTDEALTAQDGTGSDKAQPVSACFFHHEVPMKLIARNIPFLPCRRDSQYIRILTYTCLDFGGHSILNISSSVNYLSLHTPASKHVLFGCSSLRWSIHLTLVILRPRRITWMLL
jgi:hypothetical protein